jgi:hypothetical protein
MDTRGARYLNVLLGIWLFISAFVWHHSPWEFANTWILGVVTVVAALVALSVPGVQFVNTVVGIWLIISGFGVTRMNVATKWNNALVGVAILLVSLVGWRSSINTGRRVDSPV